MASSMHRTIAISFLLSLLFLLLMVCVAPTKAYAARPSIDLAYANTGSVTLAKGSNYSLGVTVTKGAKLQCSSSAKSVVSVSSKGKLKALKKGKATVTVKATLAGISTTKTVKVTVVPSSSFNKVKTLQAKAFNNELAVGKSCKISVTFNPSNASNKNVIYASSDPSVATVSRSGKVVAKKTGQTRIIATSCDNAKVKASVVLTVSGKEMTVYVDRLYYALVTDINDISGFTFAGMSFCPSRPGLLVCIIVDCGKDFDLNDSASVVEKVLSRAGRIAEELVLPVAQERYGEFKMVAQRSLFCVPSGTSFDYDRTVWTELDAGRIPLTVTVQTDVPDAGGDFNPYEAPAKIASNVASVSLGMNHSAFITKSGDLYTFGNNDYGQLGDGTTVTRNKPVKVASNVASVSLGGSHSAFITKGGDLYTFGDNSCGQLGDGTRTNRYKPVKVATNVLAVSLGDFNSAYIDSKGRLFLFGQIGIGEEAYLPYYGNHWLTPNQVASRVESIACGFSSFAFVTDTNDLYAFGRFIDYSGNTLEISMYSPEKVASGVVSVSGSSMGSYVFVTASGESYELSSGSLFDVNHVGTSVTAAKSSNSCIAFLTADGSLFMKNNAYVLVNNDGSYRPESDFAYLVAEGVVDFAYGENHHTAYVTKDGSLYTFGNNEKGQLGDGGFGSRFVTVSSDAVYK